MNFRLDIADAGQLLERFGMKDVVRRGKGRMEGQVAWLGSPLSLDYPSLDGAFNVNVEAGQFLKADPGLAKLLGVLSLQSLPRRLALDFRDVFSEGFAFDFVRGDVTIEHGIAATNNLQMKGVNAAVLMEGQADIARETQDLKVVVVPEINAGTASLVATVINPAIGLGTFLAQMFLREPLMRAATQEFHIDGTWADPRVTRVDRKPARREPADARRRPSAPAGPAEAEEPAMKVAAIQMVSGIVAARPTWPAPAPAGAGGAGRRRAGRAARILLPHGPARTRDKLAVRESLGDGAGPALPGAGRRASSASGSSAARLPLAAGDDAHVRNTSLVFSPDGRVRGALRQDPPVQVRQRARALRRVARDRARRRAAWRSSCARATATLARRPERLLRPALSRAVPRRCRPTCCWCPAPSPTSPGRRTGSCCCAPARSRTWPTWSRRRRAARTRTAAAPGATAWWSTPGARCWRSADEGDGRRAGATWTPARQAQVRTQLPALEHRVL